MASCGTFQRMATGGGSSGGDQTDEGAVSHLHALAKFARNACRDVDPALLPGLVDQVVGLIDRYVKAPSGNREETVTALKEVCPLLEGCLASWLRLVEHSDQAGSGRSAQEAILGVEGQIAHAASDLVELREVLCPETIPPSKLRAIKSQEDYFETWCKTVLERTGRKLLEMKQMAADWPSRSGNSENNSKG